MFFQLLIQYSYLKLCSAEHSWEKLTYFLEKPWATPFLLKHKYPGHGEDVLRARMAGWVPALGRPRWPSRPVGTPSAQVKLNVVEYTADAKEINLFFLCLLGKVVHPCL